MSLNVGKGAAVLNSGKSWLVQGRVLEIVFWGVQLSSKVLLWVQ